MVLPIQKGGIVLGGYHPLRHPDPKYSNIPRWARRYFKHKFKAWLDDQDTHVLLIGSTRSGKTRRIIYPTIWHLANAGESMVLNDPKGELHRATHKYLQRMGYNVIVINLRDPQSGTNFWNPLHPIVKNVNTGDDTRAAEAAKDLGQIIAAQNLKSNQDRFWGVTQKSATAALALAVAYEAPEDEMKHMTSVYRTLIELGQDGGEYLDLFFNTLPMDHMARQAYGTTKMSVDKTRSSIFVTAAADLDLFSDPSIQWMTSTQDHDMSRIGEEKTAVFLIVPDEKTTRHVLATLYVAQTYQELVDCANRHGGRLPVRVNFLLDEFGNMPPIPEMDTKITVAAGRGIRYLLAVQDTAQLENKYGKDTAKTIRGNCVTWIYIRTADFGTAKLISDMTGPYTVATENYSSNVQERTASGSWGSSEGLAGRPLVMADEIIKWDNNYALILQSGLQPAKLPILDITQWPAAKDFDLRKPGEIAAENQTRQIIIPPPIWIPGMTYDAA